MEVELPPPMPLVSTATSAAQHNNSTDSSSATPLASSLHSQVRIAPLNGLDRRAISLTANLTPQWPRAIPHTSVSLPDLQNDRTRPSFKCVCAWVGGYWSVRRVGVWESYLRPFVFPVDDKGKRICLEWQLFRVISSYQFSSSRSLD